MYAYPECHGEWGREYKYEAIKSGAGLARYCRNYRSLPTLPFTRSKVRKTEGTLL